MIIVWSTPDVKFNRREEMFKTFFIEILEYVKLSQKNKNNDESFSGD